MHETQGRVRVFDDLEFEGQQGVLIARKRHKPRAPFQPAAHVARRRSVWTSACRALADQPVRKTIWSRRLELMRWEINQWRRVDGRVVLATRGARRVDGVEDEGHAP